MSWVTFLRAHFLTSCHAPRHGILDRASTSPRRRGRLTACPSTCGSGRARAHSRSRRPATWSTPSPPRRGDLTLETVHVRTDGDRLTGSLQSLGGTGVFVTALRDALLDGRCDVAVHSLKDLPTGDADGLVARRRPAARGPRRRPVRPRRADARRRCPPAPASAPARPAARPSCSPPAPTSSSSTSAATSTPASAASPARPRDRATSTPSCSPAPASPGSGRLDAVDRGVRPRRHGARPGPGRARRRGPRRARARRAARATPCARSTTAPPASRSLAERALLGRLEAGCAAPIGALGTPRRRRPHPAPRRRGRPPGRQRDAAPRPRRRRWAPTAPTTPARLGAAARRDAARARRRRPRRARAPPDDRDAVLPLTGWRVLVPRPTAGRSPAVVALAAAGAEAVVVPAHRDRAARGPHRARRRPARARSPAGTAGSW